MRTLIQSHSFTAAGGHFGRELEYLGEYLGNVRTVTEYLVLRGLNLVSLLLSTIRGYLADGGVAYEDGKQNMSCTAAIMRQCEEFLWQNLQCGNAYAMT